ncbi:hypothetical protein P691DRAFT_283198 [Macrolepiota fuliginosa MF-IS2]|uniref:Uncharacterized protein n=1 Tax=Macrolepiota fuliginosa MF-IS2 TaxID=1400762 RepID=A0A9P6BYI9_9AGAR|nr:hypothetical protein P691DRAFT_283198 [Macrolepiota fuliginosa MF-IS2]
MPLGIKVDASRRLRQKISAPLTHKGLDQGRPHKRAYLRDSLFCQRRRIRRLCMLAMIITKLLFFGIPRNESLNSDSHLWPHAHGYRTRPRTSYEQSSHSHAHLSFTSIVGSLAEHQHFERAFDLTRSHPRDYRHFLSFTQEENVFVSSILVPWRFPTSFDLVTHHINPRNILNSGAHPSSVIHQRDHRSQAVFIITSKKTIPVARYICKNGA